MLVQTNITFLINIIANALKQTFNFNYGVLIIVLTVICGIVLIISLKYFRKPFRFLAEQIIDGCVLMLIIPVITLTIGILITTYADRNFGQEPLFYSGLVVLTELAFIIYSFNLYRNLNKIYQYDKEKNRNELLNHELESYNKEIEIMKSLRHDIRHHNRIVLEFLKENDVENAIHYLNEYDVSVQNTKNFTYSKNHILNALFRLYEKKSQKDNIDFAVVCNSSENLPVSDFELCSILSNLLENAYEACLKVNNDKYIAVNYDQTEDFLRIQIKNSSINKQIQLDHLPESEKTGGGIGLTSVSSELEKMKGVMRLEQSDGYFLTQVVIPLQRNG